MRSPRIQRSILRYPLDEIFASPALVRLIRVLFHDVAGPVGVTEAAKAAGLSAVGARKALENLERLGMAERVGTGRAQKYGPKKANPYSHILSQLFEQEQAQHEGMLEQLQRAIAVPEVRDAWIDSVSGGSGRTLQLNVIAETKAISWIGPELRTRLIEIEKQFDLIIEVAVSTRADNQEVPRGATVLWSSGDVGGADRIPGAQTHSESEERSLRMSRALAELIRTDPSLVQRALQYTNRLLREGQGTANSDIGEWRQLLEAYSPERLRELLVSKSSRADRLRRSSPFFAILTPDERDRMMKEMERPRR